MSELWEDKIAGIQLQARNGEITPREYFDLLMQCFIDYMAEYIAQNATS